MKDKNKKQEETEEMLAGKVQFFLENHLLTL